MWFSPSEELRTAEAVMMKNMQAMQDGSTLKARSVFSCVPAFVDDGDDYMRDEEKRLLRLRRSPWGG